MVVIGWIAVRHVLESTRSKAEVCSQTLRAFEFLLDVIALNPELAVV